VSGSDRPGGSRRRRRRSPEEAERQIVLAAEALLRERPFRELTVDEVMRGTELSRPSFYVYFKDRHHLVLRLVDEIGDELAAVSERWLAGEGEGPVLARQAIEGIVEVFSRHGRVLRALADAAADDPGVERAYAALLQRFVDSAAEHIEAAIADGRILPLDPRETAKALVWMNERYLSEHLGREPHVPTARLVDTLTTIWSRTLYGQDG
jgi:AcrR family transcriptional regulator